MNEPAQQAAQSLGDVTGNLRQMIAALQAERQALAELDPDALIGSANEKERLCAALAPIGADALSEDERALAQTAQHLNEVNRRVRNLLAANVASRLEAIGEARGGSATGHIARA